MHQTGIFFSISSSGLKNIDPTKYNDFTFIFNNENDILKTKTLLADFVSPKIAKLHRIDPTIHNFTIEDCNYNVFTKVLRLLEGESVEFLFSEINDLLKIGGILENDELSLLAESVLNQKLSIDNIIDILLLEDQYAKTLNNDTIEFAAAHFNELKNEKILTLTPDLLLNILKSDKLCLNDEDWLFDVVWNLYEKDSNYSDLFQYIFFPNLSHGLITKFINNILLDDINPSIWNSFTQIFTREYPIKSKEKLMQRYIGKRIDNSEIDIFDGIFSYLYGIYKSNLHSAGAVSVFSSGVNYRFPTRFDFNIVDVNKIETYFQSNDIPNSWICIDFKDMKISPTKYAIRSRHDFDQGCDHLKTWVLEASNDNINWILLDEEKDRKELDGKSYTCLYEIKNQTNQYFKYIRLRSTDANASGHYNLTFSAIEFHGYLIAPPTVNY